MKVTFLTLGCRVNQAESGVLEGSLKDRGVTVVDLNDNPDYCVINTCTVTARSDHASRQLIRRAARTGAKVIVTGCYSQLKPGLVKAIPGVWAVIDVANKEEILFEISGDRSSPSYANQSRSRPCLKIQDGCNFRCSYCSVPLARGKSRSVLPDEVVRRAKMIELAGFNEIVLTGIHLGTYGHDLGGAVDLPFILNKLLDETGISRIRLSSLEVNEINQDLMRLLEEGRVCNHLHIPLQSGCDKILGLMRRSYRKSAYREKVEEIIGRIENIAIGTDIIVGFPGEGEEEFLETFSLLRDLPLAYLHVFPFSPRENTDAAKMSDRPSRGAVEDRSCRLKELHRQLRGRYLLSQIDRRLDVVIEEIIGDRIIGTTGNYIKLAVPSAEHARGDRVFARVSAVRDGALDGTLISSC